MKNTKRLLSLILALVLCLSLAACASEEDKAFEAADALLAAGDYEGAIAAFSAIGRYQEISDKIYKAEMMRAEEARLSSIAAAEAYFGNWVNISPYYTETTVTLALNANGIGTMAWGEDTHDSNINYKDSIISLDNPIMDLKVTDIDGITHLISEEYNMDFVSEANVAAFTPIDIEITLDNWQEYFEIKEVNSISINAFGEVDYVQPCIGIFLKEEYYDRLLENYWDMELAFELTYDETAYKILNCTPDNYKYELAGQYEREPVTPPSWWKLETDCTAIGSVSDRRTYIGIPEQSPFYNTFSAEIGMYGGSANDGKTQYVAGWTNIQMSRVTGTLKLYP